MAAPDALLELVERFGRNLDSYRSGHYNETQVRLESYTMRGTPR